MKAYFVAGSISDKIYKAMKESDAPITCKEIARKIGHCPKRTREILSEIASRGRVKRHRLEKPVDGDRCAYEALPFKTTKERYLEALDSLGGIATAQQVGKQLGYSTDTARCFLLTLCERGVIFSHKDGGKRLFTLKDYGAKALFNVWR